MPRDKDELKRVVADLRRFWTPRNARFEEWYALREMKDKYKQQGELSVALNDARVLLDVSIHMLSHRPPVIRIPVLDKTEPEQKAAGGAEHFLQGIQRQIDLDRSRMGLAPWARDMADFMLCTGWWSELRMVLKNPDGTPNFISDVIDPAEVYPDFGYNMLRQNVHAYWTTLSEVQSKARLLQWEGDFTGDGTQEVEVQDVWWLEEHPDDSERLLVYNAIMVMQPQRRSGRNVRRIEDLILAKPASVSEEFAEIPLRTGPVGGWAVRGSRRNARDAQVRYGESILEAGRPLYDAKNLWFTIALRKADESLHPNALFRSPNGRFVVGENDLRSGKGIPVTTHQDIEYPQKPGLTSDVTNVVMPMLEDGVQKAGATNLLLGVIQPQDLAGAGYALSLAEPRILSKLVPFKLAMERVGSDRDTYFMEEFRTGKYKSIKLVSRTDERRGLRDVYYREWSSDEMPETSVVDWDVQISMPNQMQTKIAIARQAKPTGDLLDDDTILEQILEVGDIDRVKRGMRRMETMRDPAAAAVETIMELEDFAEALQDEAAGFREQGDERAAAKRERAAERVERIIQLRIQQLEGSQRGQTNENGLPPQSFGTQLTRQLGGTLGPAQGIRSA